MTILNLTQHPASPSQREAGVIDLEGDALASLKDLLTFTALPDWDDVQERARCIVALTQENKPKGCTAAMIGGAPYLMGPLARYLSYAHMDVLFSFTRRVVEEATLPDGSIKKVSTFVHEGFLKQETF